MGEADGMCIYQRMTRRAFLRGVGTALALPLLDAMVPAFASAGDTAAKPEIWKNMDDFKARLVKLGADAKAAGESVKDLDSFKAAFGNIGKNDCGGCHEKYRVKKS